MQADEADVTPSAAVAGAVALTRDAFLGGRVMLLQPARGYRAGVDAVLLAATARPREGCTRFDILDAGAGVGTVGLLATKRLEPAVEVQATLIERSPQLAELARRNADENGLGERVRVVCADLLGPAAGLAAEGVGRSSFDLVLANPPYHVDQNGTRAPDPVKDGAHAMAAGDLDRWARALAHLTRPDGEVAVIHRADALPELLAALSPRFGALRVLPIHPREGMPAIRVIVAGLKGSKAPLTLLPGIVLHGEGHRFTARADAILREGAPLWL